MVRTYYIGGGSPGFFQTLLRSIIVIAATIGGFFLIATSAVFAMIVAFGLLILGAVVFAVFWLRAKILGKPMSPYARMRKDFEEQLKAHGQPQQAGKDGGPIIDAHETPDGWSVDSD